MTMWQSTPGWLNRFRFKSRRRNARRTGEGEAILVCEDQAYKSPSFQDCDRSEIFNEISIKKITFEALVVVLLPTASVQNEIRAIALDGDSIPTGRWTIGEN